MYKPVNILSENKKTGHSLDLPIKGHCRPSKNCSHDCYAKSGHQALPIAQKKHKYVSNYLKRHNIKQLISECMSQHAIRLSGSGDLLMKHVPQILRLAKACPQTKFWGMTRKLEIAEALNNKLPNLQLLVTVDSSSPKKTWTYPGKLCFGPHRPNETVPSDDRIVTVFPRHFAGHVIKGVQEHPKDCPAVWHKVSGCIECQKCWN